MGDGNWKPLFIVLIITFAFALILGLVMNAFDIPTDLPNQNSSIGSSQTFLLLTTWIGSNIITTIPTGINIFGYEISIPVLNPFDLFGNTAQNWIVHQLNIMTYIPDVIIYPFMILFILAFIWTGFKLILP